jgi:hypothetical protein
LPGDAQVILVGTWEELSSLESVRNAAEHPGSSGLFVRFGSEGATVFDVLGEAARSLPKAGAIMATCRTDDSQAALWLVTGTESADVTAAGNVLARRPAELQRRFGVAVMRSGEVLPAPFEAGQ